METNTWSEEDHLHGYCTQSQIGQPIDHSIWSLRDYQERACTAAQIGQPKNPVPSPLPLAPSPLPVVPEKTYAQKLNELSEAAVDSVLNHPGGAKQWFKDNPSAHVRILTKLATPAAPDPQARIVIEIPWLQGSNRLSYRNAEPQVQDVEPQVQDVEPKAVEAWKEPAPPADVSLGVDALKKSMKPL